MVPGNWDMDFFRRSRGTLFCLPPVRAEAEAGSCNNKVHWEVVVAFFSLEMRSALPDKQGWGGRLRRARSLRGRGCRSFQSFKEVTPPQQQSNKQNLPQRINERISTDEGLEKNISCRNRHRESSAPTPRAWIS